MRHPVSDAAPNDMAAVHLAEHHLFETLGKIILINVETMLFYEVVPLIRDLVSAISEYPRVAPIKRLKHHYEEGEIQQALGILRQEGFIRDNPEEPPRPVLTRRWGIRHLELMITHGCNMACSYCYGSPRKRGPGRKPLLYGSASGPMGIDVARRGVDYLFAASGARKEVSVVFFGGEPLLEFDTILELIPHIREKERETGKKADLSLSTNGLLLTERVVRALTEHRISCQISIDGTPELQDRNRRLPDGSGSYDAILPGIRRLMDARPGRVPCRVTVAHGAVDLLGATEHLLNLGFGSVHVEPAIGGATGVRITAKDVEAIQEQNERLTLFLVKQVRNGRHFNYSNLVRTIRQTRVVRERQGHHCGAGRTYFALAQDGSFYPCHRFVGMTDYRMGDLDTGFDATLQHKMLQWVVDERPGCRDCWARYLCGGGCWKHAVDANGCLERPDERVSCAIMRHQIQCAMAINSELRVSDRDILADLYEKSTEPHLLNDDRGG